MLLLIFHQMTKSSLLQIESTCRRQIKMAEVAEFFLHREEIRVKGESDSYNNVFLTYGIMW